MKRRHCDTAHAVNDVDSYSENVLSSSNQLSYCANETAKPDQMRFVEHRVNHELPYLASVKM